MPTEPALSDALPRQEVLRQLKWWVWFRDVVHPSDLQITLAWAGAIGFGGALTSIAFRYLTSWLHKLMTGSDENGLVESFAALPWWARLTIPAMGGFLAGLVLYLGMRWRGGVTTSDYMEAVVLGDGKISTRRSLIKCLSAAFTVASGGSIGREGVNTNSRRRLGLGNCSRCPPLQSTRHCRDLRHRSRRWRIHSHALSRREPGLSLRARRAPFSWRPNDESSAFTLVGMGIIMIFELTPNGA